MAIFNSYVKLPEGTGSLHFFHGPRPRFSVDPYQSMEYQLLAFHGSIFQFHELVPHSLIMFIMIHRLVIWNHGIL